MEGESSTTFLRLKKSRLMVRRFVSPDIAKKYDLSVPEYPGIDQVVELDSSNRKL